ncbi:MAG: hypothetical protein CME06_10870 [Gemmatimonadetes bacterium]|nr:hypothetical protein [Gemmatimonadota bacterium]
MMRWLTSAIAASASVASVGCFETTLLTPDLLGEETIHIVFPEETDCDSYLEEVDLTFINAQLGALCFGQGVGAEECLSILTGAGVPCDLIGPADDAATKSAKREAGICYFTRTSLAAIDIGLSDEQLTELYECALPSHAFETLLTSESFGSALINQGLELEEFIVSAELDAEAGDILDAITRSNLSLHAVNHDTRDISLELRFAFTPAGESGVRTFYDDSDPKGALDEFWHAYGLGIDVPAGEEREIVFRGDTVVSIVDAAFEAVPEGGDATLHMAFFNDSAIYSSTDIEITDMQIYLVAESDVFFPLSYLFY